MKIKKIKVSNFKNFKNLDLELGNLNIVIGTNASGKSNFVEIFKFINRLERDTLANAISLSGGDALMNFNSSVNNLSIELLLETKYSLMLKPHRLNFTDFNYKFVLEAGRSKKIYHVSEETVEQHFSLLEGNGGTTSKKNKKLFDDESGKKGIITIHKDKNGVNSSILPESLAKEFNEKNFKLPSFPYPSDFLKKKDDPLLNKPLFFPPWERISASVCFYDLSPKTAKNLIPISGKTELEEDGKNLALILNPILEDKDKKRKLINLLSDVLPFVNNIGTKKYAEKSLMITLKEKYFSEEELRADLLSDGTIEIITLLIILFFEEKSVVFIEEPERHLHPYLLSRLVSLMKDASKNKQIIVTTHSSEIVKHADIKDILLVSRSEEGNSEIKRPADDEQVKVFLKNELGLEDLFVQNLLDT